MASRILSRLVLQIAGDHKGLSSSLSSSQRQTKSFTDNAGKNLKRLGLAGGLALAGIGIASVKMATDVDRGLREVQTLLPGLTEEGFGTLRDEVRALSDEVGKAQTEVIPALYQAISAGVPRDNVFEFLRSASDLAIGGVTDLTSSTDLLTSATNAFGEGAGSTADIADSFFTAVRLGKTTIGELSSSFSQAGPFAATLGVNLDELLAAVSAITLTGAPTAAAFTQINAAMLSLERATPPMAKALEDAGFKSGQAAIEALGLQGTLDLVRQAADATGTPLIKFTGRAEGMQAILALTGDAAERAAGIIDQFGAKSGATAAAVDTMNESFARTIERVVTLGKNILIDLGTDALPVLQEGLEWLIEHMPEIRSGVEDFADVAGGVAVDAVGALSDALDTLQDEFEGADDAGNFLLRILEIAFVETVKDAGTAVEDLSRALFGASHATDTQRIGTQGLLTEMERGFDEVTNFAIGLENYRARQEAVTQATQGLTAVTEQETGAFADAATGAELAGGELGELGIAANAAGNDLVVLEARARAVVLAMQTIELAGSGSVGGLEDFSTGAARNLQRQIGRFLPGVDDKNEIDQIVEIMLRGTGALRDAFSEVTEEIGGGGGVGSALAGVTEEAERLGDFFDTRMIVTWAEITNAILDATRAGEGNIDNLRAQVDAQNAVAEAIAATTRARELDQAAALVAFVKAIDPSKMTAPELPGVDPQNAFIINQLRGELQTQQSIRDFNISRGLPFEPVGAFERERLEFLNRVERQEGQHVTVIQWPDGTTQELTTTVDAEEEADAFANGTG